MSAFCASDFYASIEPVSPQASLGRKDIRRFSQHLAVNTKTRQLTAYSTGRTSVVSDHDSGVAIIVHGEIYGDGSNDAEDVLKRYLAHGISAVQSVHGSFVIVVCDAEADYIAVVTDRVNSRKAYVAVGKAGFLLATTPALLPRDCFQLDPTGVAWYLSHGTVYNYRTTHRGIRLLGRASVHELKNGHVASEQYWTYSFSTPSRASDRELSEELGRLLVQAVQRRLGRHNAIFLALSAGYDSAGILGALGSSLQVPGVRCFSYAQGEPCPGSDEYVSAQMAKCYGYSHRIVQSFNGDVLNLLKHNVAMGERTCEEVDAWLAMATEFAQPVDPVLFAGDECLGWTDYLLRNDADVLHAVQIAPDAYADLLKKMMGREWCDEAIAGMHDDGQAMLSRCEAGIDRHDMKDFLYLDQRMPQTIMMWREFGAGQFIPVVNPLLDSDILDFMQTVPTRLRRQKLLYRRTMDRMYPEVFRFPRARFASAQLDARIAVYHHRDTLESALKKTPSRLDELVDPAAGWKMLRELPNPQRAEFPTLTSRLRRRMTRVIAGLGVKDAMRRFVRPVVPVAPIHQTVWRWLVLRTAMAN